jgi:hypothetical protein
MVKRIIVVIIVLAGFLYAADLVVQQTTGIGIFRRLGY